MFLFVGLGNFENKYLNTRHNMGFMVIDQIIKSYQFNYKGEKFNSFFYTGSIKNEKIFIIKPKTMMNLSGSSVQKAKSFYKINLNKIVVFHDDLDLELGRTKLKKGGGTAGHNGLKDIDSCIGNSFMRIRIGIGHPGKKEMVSSYVLSDFTNKEKILVEKIITKVSNNIVSIVQHEHELFSKVSKID